MAPRWAPTTKAQEGMDPKYRPMGGPARMAAALKLVIDEGMSQSEAARRCGVTRPKLNGKVQQWRREEQERQDRSLLARRERAGLLPEPASAPQDEPAALQVANEVRRVPGKVDFNRIYFGHVRCVDCGDVQHEIPPVHNEILSMLDDDAVKRLLINIAPYHAKSTVATVRSTLQDICEDPNYRTAIVSKASRLSGAFLRQIKRHLQDPLMYDGAERNLIDDWGPFDVTGGDQDMYVGRRSSDKDPTVAAFGIGSSIYGWRFDRAVLDDVWDMSNSKNPEIVAEHVDWITGEIESRVGKAGRVDIIGTRVGVQDGYSFLQKLPGYHVIRYPVILDEDMGLTLWPEHFDIEAAHLKRGSMSPEKWQLLYQNADTLGSDAAFTLEMIEKCRNTTRQLGQFDPGWLLCIGLDPAGANKQSGYTALVLLGVDLRTGKRHLVDIVNAKQLKAPQLKQQLFQWAEQYRPRELRVESNGLQSQLVQYNEEIIAKMTASGTRVVPHITTGRNKWDEQFGVESMSPMFYNGMIDMPYGDINARKKVGELEEQLLQFPLGQTTDLYMALWFAELGCRELYQRSAAPAFDAKMKMPGRIRRQRRVVDFATGQVRGATDAEQAGFSSLWADELTEQRRPLNVGV